MYDKIKIRLDGSMIDTPPQKIVYRLNDATEEYSTETGEYIRGSGRLERLKVQCFRGGVSIIGSLSKYYYGNNFYPLDRHTTARAFEKMSDALHIDMRAARVVGLEYGATFWMKHPPAEYIKRLGDCPKFKRVAYGAGTVYYQTKGRRRGFCVYDKGAEEHATGQTLPPNFETANLLRCEMRLDGILPRQMGVPEVTASTLSDYEFYRLMMQRYQAFYKSIRKRGKEHGEDNEIMNEIKTVNDAYDVFVAKLIRQSRPEDVAEFLEELKQHGVFHDRKYYTRLKQKIAKATDTVVKDELLQELDNDFMNVGVYL